MAKANARGEEDGKRNEAREPKDHGQTVGTEQGVLRCCAREFHWRNNDIDESENGPDTTKD